MSTRRNLFGFTLASLEEEMLRQGEKRYRARQLFEWIYGKGCRDFALMSDISQKTREMLAQEYELTLPSVYLRQDAKDGTIKLLLSMADGAKVECVLMRYDYGNAICVSSQVGCQMGCAFCASGLLKKERDLRPEEMVGEVLVMNALLAEEGERVSHIVVMGTGEPFDNYDNVMAFVRIMNDPKGLAIGARHITISTCGLAPGIRRFGDEGLQVNLAISLHAPSDELRKRLMPVARRYALSELLEAIREYIVKTSRRVTFEYILIKGVNDGEDDAERLCGLLRGILCYVNLIPLNPVAEKPFERSAPARTKAFSRYLNDHGVNCTVRKEWGSGIDAACGQLRAKIAKGE